jgi:hypothetical protein
MAGLVPAIHVLSDFGLRKTWMPGTRLVLEPAEGRTLVPGMTDLLDANRSLQF